MNEDKMELEKAIEIIKSIIYDKKGNPMNYIDISFSQGEDDIGAEEFIKAIEIVLQELRDKEKEIEKLYTIRNEVDYGYENVHIITKNRLVTIEKNKCLIEIKDGKFIDLQELYNNSIPKKKIEDKLKDVEDKYNNSVNNVYKKPTEALIDFQRIIGAKEILQEILED